MYHLLYNLIPLPREFGYLCVVLGSGTTATFQHNHSIFPIRDTVTIFTVSYIGTRNHFSTVVIIPDAATCCMRGHSATVVIIPYAATRCTRGHSSTVVIIPSSVTSGARDSFLR